MRKVVIEATGLVLGAFFLLWFVSQSYACVLNGTGNGPCDDSPAPPGFTIERQFGPTGGPYGTNVEDRNGFTHHGTTRCFGGTCTTRFRD